MSRLTDLLEKMHGPMCPKQRMHIEEAEDYWRGVISLDDPERDEVERKGNYGFILRGSKDKR